MNNILGFGEQIDGYPVRVLNERAVRASAGLLFLAAIVAFMNAWLTGNFQPTRVFVVGFLIDFAVRIFINPRHAPSLIVGQWFVRHQQPEYVGAPQKRFAWAIGFVLALAMFYLVVLDNVVGPINLIVCATCLLLMFFETAFGICIGCKLYNLFNPDQARLCPGGVCEVKPTRDVHGTPTRDVHGTPTRDVPRTPTRGAGGGGVQAAIVIGFAALVSAAGVRVAGPHRPAAVIGAGIAPDPAAMAAPVDAAEAERCKVPAFAKALGHEAMWKLHNHCQ